jgi:isopenicillin-N N-acyltransferase like protein
MRQKILVFHLIAFLSLIFLPALRAEDDRFFREGKYQAGELRYINGVPVLSVAGSPVEIGRQKAELTADTVKKMTEYPQRLLDRVAPDPDGQKKFLEAARTVAKNIPADHKAELRAFADQAKMGDKAEVGLLGNVMIDIYRGSFGCSSLVVEAKNSKTGGPLFGRNLDFFTLGIIQNATLVTVHRPTGKHAFAAIGFPGLFGCLSGMNDAGLSLAVHEVFLSKDGSLVFSPNLKGVPYTFLFRRILEECATVEEAEKLLRGAERTTLLNLLVCDRKHAVVFELTPRTVAVRRPENGVLACTNHFRTPELAVFKFDRRYPVLAQSADELPLGVEDIHRKLHAVNKGRLTVQTMIFEPDPLILHLAAGSCPSTALPLKKIELAPLFQGKKSDDKKSTVAGQ